MEADSRLWMLRCSCGFEQSWWDAGGIRWKAVGNPRRWKQCPQCLAIHLAFELQETNRAGNDVSNWNRLTSAHSTESAGAPGDIFATTHWTVVLAAGQRRTPQSTSALEELCRTYWYPLYAYVRRRGHSKEDAEDLTQAFFARFLEKNYLERLNAERGRFRAFLLASLKHFLANEWDKAQRQKRGGHITHLSLDWQTADTQFQVAATTEPSPDKAFDREWAVALLGKVIEQLSAECDAEGRAKQFAELKIFLTAGKGALPYADVAKRSAWMKAPSAWPCIGCASATANCCATKSPTPLPTPPRWMRRCGRCSGRSPRSGRTALLPCGQDEQQLVPTNQTEPACSHICLARQKLLYWEDEFLRPTQRTARPLRQGRRRRTHFRSRRAAVV